MLESVKALREQALRAYYNLMSLWTQQLHSILNDIGFSYIIMLTITHKIFLIITHF